VQGGFAGSNCISQKNQLKRFKGLSKFPTYNFNGFQKGAWAFLNSSIIEKKYLISKDVTHGVFYDSQLHDKVGNYKNSKPEFKLMWKAMEYYLDRNPKGKKLHDPLAACTAINPSIISFREVELFEEKGKWGSFPRKGSDIYISVGVDYELFIKTFLDK
jgi:pyrimidine-specific ribonucleoside hydrolase